MPILNLAEFFVPGNKKKAHGSADMATPLYHPSMYAMPYAQSSFIPAGLPMQFAGLHPPSLPSTASTPSLPGAPRKSRSRGSGGSARQGPSHLQPADATVRLSAINLSALNAAASEPNLQRQLRIARNWGSGATATDTAAHPHIVRGSFHPSVLGLPLMLPLPSCHQIYGPAGCAMQQRHGPAMQERTQQLLLRATLAPTPLKLPTRSSQHAAIAAHTRAPHALAPEVASCVHTAPGRGHAPTSAHSAHRTLQLQDARQHACDAAATLRHEHSGMHSEGSPCNAQAYACTPGPWDAYGAPCMLGQHCASAAHSAGRAGGGGHQDTASGCPSLVSAESTWAASMPSQLLPLPPPLFGYLGAAHDLRTQVHGYEGSEGVPSTIGDTARDLMSGPVRSSAPQPRVWR